MCMWNSNTRAQFGVIVNGLIGAGERFDVLDIRNALRKAVGPSVNILYGDVAEELWHLFRKGKLGMDYIAKPKTVVHDGDSDVTLEYMPSKMLMPTAS